jgi:hypothetical protein
VVSLLPSSCSHRTIEKCNFSEPLTLSAKDLETLQILPGVTLSANSFPKARTDDCVETALYEGYDVCLTSACLLLWLFGFAGA